MVSASTPQSPSPQAGVHAALPNSTIIPVSAGLQCWPSPHVAIDLEQVALLMGETNLALLIETGFLEVVCKSTAVSLVFCLRSVAMRYSLFVVDPRLQHDFLRAVVGKPTIVHQRA